MDQGQMVLQYNDEEKMRMYLASLICAESFFWVLG